MLDKHTFDRMNLWLVDNFGYFADQARFRLSWSEDQREIRIGSFTKTTKSGLYLGEEIGQIEVKKYQHFTEKYVLEQLLPNPHLNEIAGKVTYEPLWVFGKDGDPTADSIDPTWDALQFLMYCVTSYRPGVGVKYLQDDPEQEKESRLQKIESELFGNETVIGDALAQREAVFIPQKDVVDNGKPL